MDASLFDGEAKEGNSPSQDPTASSNGANPSSGESEDARGENSHSDGEAEGEEVEACRYAPSPRTSLEPAREEIERELESLSRAPFRRILRDFLGFTPTAAALRRFAEKNPDKWAKSISILAQLGGFQNDVNVTNNIVNIGSMDDSALRKRMADLEAKLGISHNMIVSIENTPSPVLRERNPTSPDIIDVKATVTKDSPGA